MIKLFVIGRINHKINQSKYFLKLQNQIDISLLVITKALGKKADDDGKGEVAEAALV